MDQLTLYCGAQQAEGCASGVQAGVCPKPPPAPRLISSLALKHVLKSKFSLSWAPGWGCRPDACACRCYSFTWLPWEACSEHCARDALLCFELNSNTMLLPISMWQLLTCLFCLHSCHGGSSSDTPRSTNSRWEVWHCFCETRLALCKHVECL